ncbi:MAG: hypothetical protein ACYC91_08300 [Solirubrobacteraceae bacterium]
MRRLRSSPRRRRGEWAVLVTVALVAATLTAQLAPAGAPMAPGATVDRAAARAATARLLSSSLRVSFVSARRSAHNAPVGSIAATSPSSRAILRTLHRSDRALLVLYKRFAAAVHGWASSGHPGLPVAVPAALAAIGGQLASIGWSVRRAPAGGVAARRLRALVLSDLALRVAAVSAFHASLILRSPRQQVGPLARALHLLKSDRRASSLAARALGCGRGCPEAV